MLLELSSLPQVPGADGVVQATSPQLGPVVRDVYAARAICVTLELPAEPTAKQNIVHIHARFSSETER